MGVPVKLVRIGNSRGVRIPKALREAARLGDNLELSVAGRSIVISPRVRRPRAGGEADARAGWEAAFRAAGPSDGDEIMFPEPFDNEFDRTEWTWPGVSDVSTSTSSRSTRRSARKSARRGPA